ncbi:quinoprotein relay system zinc metallohydrolase 2 [Ruegeria meonggei]|uniref:Hydroxyacylglutathione hydrolase n=1 Tax=Ruegeria meonggei TaxID=1446476 RepID=A0A1X7A3P4_9RHOB|nr:quinoprotein relay system zinc metallohydrolase 2 [Ruegeria meonggei]SLN69573.1 Hydroxyacylglutathione hydrolase [Ruegeria meonggei]
MFEAVILVCAQTATELCREQLLPGYEAEYRVDCELELRVSPPLLTDGHSGEPFCQPVGQKLNFDEVAPGLFVHLGLIEEPLAGNLGDISNIGFVIGQDSVAVIDTGTAPWMGEAIWRAVRTETDKPVSHVILTHMHPDHTLGTAPLTLAGAKVVGHAGLERALLDRLGNYVESLSTALGPEAYLGVEPITVEIEVETEEEIDLGGRKLILRAWPRAHTGNDLTVMDVNSGVLFTGDLVFHRHIPALDGELIGWQRVLKKLTGLEVTQIVPGHGGPLLAWPEGAADMLHYLDVLETDTRAAIDSGQRLGDAVETIAQEEAEHWDLFETYNPRNATVAFTELEWE